MNYHDDEELTLWNSLHILQDFPDLASQREKVWPGGVALEDKLWGTCEDLKHTILFKTHDGIWQTLIHSKH